MPRSTPSIGAGVALAALLACAVSSLAADAVAPVDGQDVGELRLRLQLLAPEPALKTPPQFEVVIANVGGSDLNLNLGITLANGRQHHPTALRLVVRGPGNQTRTLEYAGPNVAGRVDPLVAPLPIGSSYTLRCGFNRFVDTKTGAPLDLSAHEYRIAAEFVGEAVTEANPDVEGLTLMPYWQGTVRSNEVPLPLAK